MITDASGVLILSFNRFAGIGAGLGSAPAAPAGIGCGLDASKSSLSGVSAMAALGGGAGGGAGGAALANLASRAIRSSISCTLGEDGGGAGGAALAGWPVGNPAKAELADELGGTATADGRRDDTVFFSAGSGRDDPVFIESEPDGGGGTSCDDFGAGGGDAGAPAFAMTGRPAAGIGPWKIT